MSAPKQCKPGHNPRPNRSKIRVGRASKQGCVTDVILVSAEDNCQGSEFENSCGHKGKDCVCMKPNKFVNWEIDNNARFEVQFINQNPLKENCKMKSGGNNELKCQVASTDGDYEYNVAAQSCPGNSYDPKIIIRK